MQVHSFNLTKPAAILSSVNKNFTNSYDSFTDVYSHNGITYYIIYIILYIIFFNVGTEKLL